MIVALFELSPIQDNSPQLPRRRSSEPGFANICRVQDVQSHRRASNTCLFSNPPCVLDFHPQLLARAAAVTITAGEAHQPLPSRRWLVLRFRILAVVVELPQAHQETLVRTERNGATPHSSSSSSRSSSNKIDLNWVDALLGNWIALLGPITSSQLANPILLRLQSCSTYPSSPV